MLYRRWRICGPPASPYGGDVKPPQVYGAARRRNAQLAERIQHLIHHAGVVLPFDEVAARTYGELRATLEQAGQPLAEPDLRIASIALANELTVVTGTVRHFDRVPGLAVENWLEEPFSS